MSMSARSSATGANRPRGPYFSRRAAPGTIHAGGSRGASAWLRDGTCVMAPAGPYIQKFYNIFNIYSLIHVHRPPRATASPAPAPTTSSGLRSTAGQCSDTRIAPRRAAGQAMQRTAGAVPRPGTARRGPCRGAAWAAQADGQRDAHPKLPLRRRPGGRASASRGLGAASTASAAAGGITAGRDARGGRPARIRGGGANRHVPSVRRPGRCGRAGSARRRHRAVPTTDTKTPRGAGSGPSTG